MKPNAASLRALCECYTPIGVIYPWRRALKRAGYARFRSQLVPDWLVPVLRDNPQLIEGWVRYVEDKRGDFGWILQQRADLRWVVCYRADCLWPATYEDGAIACAQFLVREFEVLYGKAPWERKRWHFAPESGVAAS